MAKLKKAQANQKLFQLGMLFFLVVILFWYLLVLQPLLNNRRKDLPIATDPQRVAATATPTPRPSPLTSTGEKYFTRSRRVSLEVPKNWLIFTDGQVENGEVLKIQGPHQVLRIYEGVQPDYGFDDFTLGKITTFVAGKRYTATKFTSNTWGSSFASVHIQDSPYQLYIEYGNAASWGFNGFDQKHDDKVNFEKDVQPIQTMLQTLEY